MLLLFSHCHVQLFCKPMDYGLPGSSAHRISQARTVKWVAISFSRGSSWPRDQTHVSCTGRWILYHWPTREAWTHIQLIPFAVHLKLNNTVNQLYANKKFKNNKQIRDVGWSIINPELSTSQQSALQSRQQYLHFSEYSSLCGSKGSQPTREEVRRYRRQRDEKAILGSQTSVHKCPHCCALRNLISQKRFLQHGPAFCIETVMGLWVTTPFSLIYLITEPWSLEMPLPRFFFSLTLLLWMLTDLHIYAYYICILFGCLSPWAWKTVKHDSD